MRTKAAVLVLLLALAPMSAVLASQTAPVAEGSSGDWLIVDGYVTTKFTSVGDTVSLHALTKGHSGDASTTNTVVTAEILHYEDLEAFDLIVNQRLPSDGVVIDTVVLTPSGAHEEDSDALLWEGVYTVPLTSIGGVYGASITAEEGNLVSTDDATQIPNALRDEIESVLQAIDTTWDTANPMMDIKGVFDGLNASGQGSGGWTSFVDDASRQPGLGDSAQLWNNMIAAGYNNPSYDMADGARFLEALLDFLESSDQEAGMAFLTGVLVYGDEFPLPRTLDDFDEVVAYMQAFDPIENFTRFAGTDNFSAAYDAMVGSEEWEGLSDALDNLSNNEMVFASFQTVLRNIALLSVSAHPEAIIDGLEAWVAPLADEDYANMTPFQRLVYGWSQMDVTVQDLDGDDFPDEILWEYELLLNTTEGLQWQARMDTSYPHVSAGFDDFNGFDVDVLTILRDTTEDPAWDDAGNAVQDFLSWAANATLEKDLEWVKSDDGSNDDEDEDDGGSEDSSNSTWEEIIFDDLYPVETLTLNKYKLDLGFELHFECEGCADSDTPNDFNMSVTDSSGQVTNVVLNEKPDHHYTGRFTADRAGAEVYTFSQPMAGWTPPCADNGCSVQRATLKVDSLRPSLLESMGSEANEELFVVSAVGVLVDADETVLVASEMDVQASVYDAADGALIGAEMDTALLRISPGLGASAAASLSPNGDMVFDPSGPTVQYSGDDVDGVLNVTVEPRQSNSEGEPLNGDPAAFDGYLSASGDAFGWNVSSDVNAQVSRSARGVALFTTTGITVDGLEFRYEHEAPLPDSPGCMISTMETWSQGELNIEWSYASFRSEDGTPYPFASLNQVDIDYGDGSSFSSTAPMESGSESYTYDTSDATTEHLVTVQYTTEHGHVNDLSFTFDENDGIQAGEDGEEYHTSYFRPYEDYSYCQLKGEQRSSTPSPAIIDRFISDGPFEVLDQQVLTSNAQGTVTLTATPSHTGAYVNLVQASHTDALTGITRTGIGFNVAMATTATVGLSGMDVIDHFAGLPVYAANVSGISQSVQVFASGLENVPHHAMVGHLPLDFSEVFPDVNFTGESEMHEMTFNSGESSRNVTLNHTAPLSMVGVMMGPSSADEEGMSDPLTPAAMHIGLIVLNPEELNLTGSLGPGQTTNVALHEDLEAATRILAVASPSQGFDPAVIDTSTVSELLMTEAVRPEVEWAGIESDLMNVCEEISWWAHSHWDDASQSEVHVLEATVHHRSDDSHYGSGLPAPNLAGATLIDESSGAEVNWTLMEVNGQTAMVRYDLPHAYASYRFSSGTSYGSSFTMEYTGEEWEEAEWNPACDNDLDQDEQADDVIDFLDTYASRFSTVAWGQGSSADLALPALSSPISEYTVIGVAQQGSGTDATLVSAVSTVLSVPDPEPPRMENLTLVFTPSDPAPGDVVLLTVTDESNQPIEGLSVTLVKDNMTLSSLLSDANGQTSFAIPQGNITIRVSGGLYYPAELTLSVEEEGIDGGLPGDRDGDGVGDTLDAFPDDPQEWDDTDGDGIGDNADSDDDGDGRSDLMELTGIPATDPLWPDTDNDGYCDGPTSVPSICTGGDVFPTDATEWVDTDDDAVGNNRDNDDDGDGALDEHEIDCGTDPLLDTSVPSDVDNDGICDALDDTDDRLTGDDSKACCEAMNAECLACAAGMTVEAYCAESPDTTGCAEDDGPTGEQSESGAALSSTVLIAASATGALLVAIFVAVLVLRGRESEPPIDKAFAAEEAMFNELAASISSNLPSRPPKSATGEMYDGYEGLEYPAGSDQWYYRDPGTGEWTEWR